MIVAVAFCTGTVGMKQGWKRKVLEDIGRDWKKEEDIAKVPKSSVKEGARMYDDAIHEYLL